MPRRPNGGWLVLGVAALSSAAACDGGKGAPDHMGAVAAGPKRTSDPDAMVPDRGGAFFTPRLGGSSTGSSPASSADGGIARLGSEELDDLCAELDARFKSRVTVEEASRFTCTLQAISLTVDLDADGLVSVDPAECQAEVDRCTVSSPSAARVVDCAGLRAAVSGCELSVEVFEDCFDAQVARIAAALDMLSCSAFGDEDTIERALALGDPSSLPECLTLADECPDLLPTSGDRSTGMAVAVERCNDGCLSAHDEKCDDGGEGASTDSCKLGSDCDDCGPR